MSKEQKNLHREALLNDFAIRSFRDVADQDYIAARMAYRTQLFIQFYWSGLQAVEKYLKAILLFNRIPAKDIGHDLEKALQYAEKLPFTLELTDPARELIGHLSQFGRFRYLEGSYHVLGPKLVELDRTVWEIRRYCRRLDYSIELRGGEEKEMLPLELARIEASAEQPPHEFRITHRGLLEKIIDDRKHPARPPLIWQNLYFGTKRRRKVRMPTPVHATNAPLALHPEVLNDVLEYVYLPSDVVKAYREELERRRAEEDG